MEPETQDILREIWTGVPKREQGLILAQAHREVVKNATNSIMLDEENRAALEQEVLFVLLGLQTTQEFGDEVMRNPILTQEQAVEFVGRVNNELFSSLKLDNVLQDEQSPSSDTVVSGAHTENTGARVDVNTIHTAIDAYGLVKERLERLPPAVQATIRSQELENNLETLLSKHAFDQNLTPVFVAEAVRVMVGLTTTNNFKTEVTRAAGWDPNKLDALFLDAESLLFKPVRMAIMQTLEQAQSVPTKNREPIPTTPPTPPKPPETQQAQDPYREAV